MEYAYFYVRSNCGSGQVSSYSDVSFIELPSCPSISISASVATFCFGESSTLTATGDFDSYQWYNDDGAIDGAVSSTYTATAGGHYYAIGLTSSGCSITSNGVSLTMITLSAVSVLEVDNITSSSANLNWDNASPANVYNISYSSDGGDTWVDITSHTGSYISLSGLQSSTTYDVEITSTAYDCESAVFSGSFTTTVDCTTPENISLTATPFNVTLSWDALESADSYYVVYYLPSTGWQGETVTDTFLTLSHNGNGYAYFYVRSECGAGQVSSYSDVSFIELPSCPSISISASVATFCLGESSTLTATGDFDSYQWYNDDGAIDGAVSSTYTATAGGHYYAVGLTSVVVPLHPMGFH